MSQGNPIATRTPRTSLMLAMTLVAGLIVLSAGPLQASVYFATGTPTEATATSAEPVVSSGTSECPGGFVLTGLDWDSLDYLDGTTSRCSRLTLVGPDLVATGAALLGASVGITGYPGDSSDCPSGQVVTGFIPRSGGWIEAITPLCQGFDGSETSGLETPAPMIGSSGTAQPTTRCPAGDVAVGSEAELGNDVDWGTVYSSFSLICAPIEKVWSFRPDGRFGSSGDGVYNTSGASQTATVKVAAGKSKSLTLNIENDGNITEGFVLHGALPKKPFAITITDDMGNVTSQVKNGTYATEPLVPGSSVALTLAVSAKAGSSGSNGKTASFTVSSLGDPDAADVVKVKCVVKK